MMLAKISMLWTPEWFNSRAVKETKRRVAKGNSVKDKNGEVLYWRRDKGDPFVWCPVSTQSSPDEDGNVTVRVAHGTFKVPANDIVTQKVYVDKYKRTLDKPL